MRNINATLFILRYFVTMLFIYDILNRNQNSGSQAGARGQRQENLNSVAVRNSKVLWFPLSSSSGRVCNPFVTRHPPCALTESASSLPPKEHVPSLFSACHRQFQAQPSFIVPLPRPVPKSLPPSPLPPWLQLPCSPNRLDCCAIFETINNREINQENTRHKRKCVLAP